MKMINPVILQLALQYAANRAYKEEIVDTEMEDATIGVDGEYETPEGWVQGKMDEWISAVKKKFKLFRQSEEIEVDEKVILFADIFFNIKLGETKKLNKDVSITRVPGGWMWVSVLNPNPGTFIPYSDEFLSTIKGEV